jgi:RNA polymerase sigma factor (sigma-70 family)
MPPDPTPTRTRQLLSAVLRHGPRDGPPDRDLLARFVAARDEEAFAELVRRHGAVVLAVCRRVTGHAQDAEDAFQAAFLVLARRAAHVTRPELLGNWLYGVAYRTALDARSARRRVREHQPVSDTDDLAAPTASEGSADLGRVIDEELARLPEKYRAAVVLCDLEGLGRRDAAQRLRIPEGTLSSRLAHARKVLAGRLSRRGVTTSAGALAAALGRDAIASAVPHGLVQHTARAAARSLAGGVVPPDVISTRVMSLTDGVMKAMIATRLRLMTGAGVLVLGMIGLGAAVTGQPPLPPADPNRTTLEVLADPFAAQPPGKEKGKAPEKIPAKGIEDDDVPYSSVPTQAVVRLEDGKMVVRQRTRGARAVTVEAANGQKYQTLQQATRITGYRYDNVADVAAFDMKGNRIQSKVWREKLKEDQHVLVAFDGRLPQPRELTLFKDDTLLIVFPGHEIGEMAPVPITSYRQRITADGKTYYEPVTTYGYPPPAGAIPAAPGAGNYPPPTPPTGETPATRSK